MLKGMQHHYTKGFLYSVIKFEWSSYTQLSAHYSATTGSLFRTCGSIHSQYSSFNTILNRVAQWAAETIFPSPPIASMICFAICLISVSDE